MSNLLARILLAILMFPLGFIVFFVISLLLMDAIGPFYTFLWAYIVTALIVAYYWIKLWQKTVLWTPFRKIGTLVSAAACLIVSFGIGTLIVTLNSSIGGEEEIIVLIGGLFSIISWLIITVLLWKETADERAERVRQSAGDVLFCLKCGYNMTGLYQSRCPECGTQYTLDQLLTGQKRETAEETVTQV